MDGKNTIRRIVLLLSALAFVSTSHAAPMTGHDNQPNLARKTYRPGFDQAWVTVKQHVDSPGAIALLSNQDMSLQYNLRLQDIQKTTLYTSTADKRIARRGWLDKGVRKAKRVVKKITRKYRRVRKQIKRGFRKYKNKIAKNVGKGFRQAKRTIRIARRHVKRKYKRVKLFIRRSHRKVRVFIRGRAR